MSEKPEILFATLAAGGSHVSSAKAMAQAIQKHFPDQYETPIREIMVDYGFGDWVAKHNKSWRWQLAHPSGGATGGSSSPSVHRKPATLPCLCTTRSSTRAAAGASRGLGRDTRR